MKRIIGALLIAALPALVGALWLNRRVVEHHADQDSSAASAPHTTEPTIIPVSAPARERAEASPEPKTSASAPTRAVDQDPSRRTPCALHIFALDSRGEPVPNCKISVTPSSDRDFRYQARGREFVADARGRATYDDWPNGVALAISVTAPADVPLFFEAREYYPPPGAAEWNIYIRAAQCGAVRGRLVIESSGASVEGAVEASITRDDRDKHPRGHTLWTLTSTNSDGTFELAGLVAGKWRLSADGTDTSTTNVSFSVSDGVCTELGDIRLPEPAFLDGVVVNSQGAPMADVQLSTTGTPMTRVHANDFEWMKRRKTVVRSDADGRFHVQAAPGLDAFMSARAVGAGWNSLARSVGPFRAPQSNIRIEIGEGSTLQVEVRRKESGRSVTRAQVEVRRYVNHRFAGTSGYLDVDKDSGVCSVSGILPGDYTIIAAAAGAGEGIAQIRIDDDKDHRVVVEMSSAEGRVTAKFVDTSGTPISQLPVNIWIKRGGALGDALHGCTTDFDGRMSFPGAGRSLRVEIDVPGFEKKSIEVELRENETLRDLGTIDVRRTD